MSLPYQSASNLPLGFETVSCGGTHIVEAVSGNSFTSRVISRTDANGDLSDYMIRKNSEPVEVTITCQRADTSASLPTAGTTFTYDFDRSGTAHAMVVKDLITNRDKDAFDTFDIVATVTPPAASS